MTKTELNAAVEERLSEMDAALAVIPDENAAEAMTLFRKWEPGVEVTVDKRLQHAGKLYKVIQPHMTQAGWEPDITPALFTEIARPGEIPDWKQPTGAQDAYQAGDKVRHNGQIWESTVDANVWEPGVYGWNVVPDQ